jgi:hypothetical protein
MREILEREIANLEQQEREAYGRYQMINGSLQFARFLLKEIENGKASSSRKENESPERLNGANGEGVGGDVVSHPAIKRRRIRKNLDVN